MLFRFVLNGLDYARFDLFLREMYSFSWFVRVLNFRQIALVGITCVCLSQLVADVEDGKILRIQFCGYLLSHPLLNCNSLTVALRTDCLGYFLAEIQLSF